MNFEVAKENPDSTPDTVVCNQVLASLLAVSSMQIELAVEEGSERMQELGQLFTELAAILDAATAEGHSPPLGSATPAVDCASRLREVINQALIRMQFYDRLSQRLSHVSTGLRVVQAHLTDLARGPGIDRCAGLVEEIRAKYSLEDEKLVFNSIINGARLSEARESHGARPSGSGAIELF